MIFQHLERCIEDGRRVRRFSRVYPVSEEVDVVVEECVVFLPCSLLKSFWACQADTH